MNMAGHSSALEFTHLNQYKFGGHGLFVLGVLKLNLG